MSNHIPTADDVDDTVTQPGRAPLQISSFNSALNIDWAGATSIGLVRTRNEDRWIHVGDSSFAVADGMGGHSGGEQAAMAAIEGFVGVVENGPSQDWSTTIAHLNGRVRADLERQGLNGGGTTLSAALVSGDLITIIHVGDSRVLRFRDGALDQLTMDHTLDSELRAAGAAEPSRNLRNALTSYLGVADDLLRVDSVVHQVRMGDIYVLCSDGVHGQLTVEEIVAVLERNASAQGAADALVSSSDAAGGRDNATAVVLRF